MPVRTEIAMGTVVKIDVRSSGCEVDDAVERAFGWFREIEARCTRFDEQSELRRVSARTGVAVPVSPILFEAVRFALLAAETTGGAFDPTVGRVMEGRGFRRNYRTGEIPVSGGPADGASWHEVELDPCAQTIRLLRPLTLDLGGVAKGFAVDLAARELAGFRDFAIDAGGDLYLAGRNGAGKPWQVGIPHPRIAGELIATFAVSDRAICTSGDYERCLPGGEHHIVDPRIGNSPRLAASATVIAPNAILADALATAALVLGPQAGIDMLEQHGLEGLIVTPETAQYRTRSLSDAA